MKTGICKREYVNVNTTYDLLYIGNHVNVNIKENRKLKVVQN